MMTLAKAPHMKAGFALGESTKQLNAKKTESAEVTSAPPKNFLEGLGGRLEMAFKNLVGSGNKANDLPRAVLPDVSQFDLNSNIPGRPAAGMSSETHTTGPFPEMGKFVSKPYTRPTQGHFERIQNHLQSDKPLGTACGAKNYYPGNYGDWRNPTRCD